MANDSHRKCISSGKVLLLLQRAFVPQVMPWSNISLCCVESFELGISGKIFKMGVNIEIFMKVFKNED